VFAVLCVCLFAAFSKAGFWEVPDSPRRVTGFNLGWEFSLDEFGSSKTVALPHCIDEGELGYEASGCVNRQQSAWYRKRFIWHRSAPKTFLHFEAIMGQSRITVNGKPAAEHFGGYLPIHLDVTDLLKDGENEIVVWADNSDDDSYPPGKPQAGLDFAYFGGIYRDVWLVETGETYVTDSDRGGVYVTSTLEKDGSWTVRADVTLGGLAAKEAETRLFYDGQPVSTVFKPQDPALWSPDEPNLHLLRVEVWSGGKLSDAVGVRFGIRDFTIDANGLTLNGKPYPKKLIGVNRHQDCLFLGMALPNSIHWRDVKKFHDCGMRAFRNAHYPQDPAFMDACDELGMFVIVNTPGWQFWNKDNPLFGERVKDDILKLVRRDRSRPSVLMWEPILNETSYPAKFALEALALVKRETRAPNYCGCDVRAKGADRFDITFSPSETDPKKPCYTREWGDFPDDWDAQNSSSRMAAEWGEGPQVEQARHYRDEKRMGSLWSVRNSERRCFGGTMWHGTDHARGFHPDNFFGGLLTYGRQKKYSWHMMKAELTDEPYVFLAHELAPGSPHEMPVYSNCVYQATWLGKPFIPGVTRFFYDELQEMTYYPKDESLVEKAHFAISLPDGTTRKIFPAKRVDHLSLSPDFEGLPAVADGSDLVAINAVIVDRNETPKRYVRETIVFDVEGPAEIVGENPQSTRWGEAMVYLRLHQTEKPESIRVTARYGRTGKVARVSGSLVFTPGSLAYTAKAGPRGDDSGVRAAERQQKHFDINVDDEP